MKYLDLPTLSRIHGFLERVDVGDLVVRGTLEAYSCKLAGLDKKLSRSLEEEVMESCSPLQLSRSPVGPLVESSSRKTLVYLILTLNHIYPDYDFTLLRAQNFAKEESLARVQELVGTHLVDVARAWDATPGLGEEGLLDAVWTGVEESIELADADIYSYKSDLESDPFGEKGSVWSFNYFFYNRKLKRILYFSCRGMNKSAVELSETTEGARYNSDSENELEGDAATSMANEMDL
ncbi:hypothetical protein QBZ16_004435 [Prototheca wickerhamii]|uniref:Repressor of RNA polymerase III transcription n=1 Tax=Prototheca wickerhamii TaxID=3111 RepID=A0AAD9IHY1_PROWI|nr:hypothetical protein QBZ16_004435 [Prototheca wickerhamii]